MTMQEMIDAVARSAAHAQRDLEDDRMDRQMILEELLDRLDTIVTDAQGAGE